MSGLICKRTGERVDDIKCMIRGRCEGVTADVNE